MSRGTTVKECKSYCNEGCGAIEWWEGGGQACYLCTDLSLLIEFPYTRDLSYPPHVFIKQSGMSGCVLFFFVIWLDENVVAEWAACWILNPEVQVQVHNYFLMFFSYVISSLIFRFRG